MPFIYVDVHLKTILAITLFMKGMPVCQKIEFAARLSSCEVERFEVHVKHSYFSNYFIMCLPSFFSCKN